MTAREKPAHGGQRRWVAETYGRDERSWLDFSANLNPLGPPKAVRAALAAGLGQIVFYPDLEAKAATLAVAGYLKVAPDHILLTSGGMEAIYLAVRALQPAAALIAEPAFMGYREACAAAQVPAEGFTGRLEELLRRELEPRQMVLVGQPGNPTGQLEDPQVLMALLERLAAQGGNLLLDEAFIDFLPEPEAYSLRHAAGRPGLLVTGSLTKFFTLPGLRVGYALGPPPLLDALRRLKTPWSVSTLAQISAAAAVQDAEFIAASRRLLPIARLELATALRKLGLFEVQEGQANYLLLDAAPSGLTAAQWAEGAARRGIMLRDASGFPGLTRYHLRVAVRRADENERLVAVLREIGEDRSLRQEDREV